MACSKQAYKITICNTSSRRNIQVPENLRRGENIYPMTKKCKGFCVIIDNYYFEGQTPRLGGREDAVSLEDIFNQIGYNIQKIIDSTRGEILNRLRQLAKDEHLEHHDSFTLIFSSHGWTDGKLMCGIKQNGDLDFVTVNEIIDIFNDISCPLLKGKPKIFFFNCCRGGDDDELLTDDPRINPDRNDMFIGYATREGKISNRHPYYGTYFCQSLVRALINHCHEKELIELFQILKKDVQTTTMKEVIYIGRKQTKKIAQNPVYVLYNFNKSLFFNPRVSEVTSENISLEYDPVLELSKEWINDYKEIERVHLGMYGEIFRLRDDANKICALKKFEVGEDKNEALKIARSLRNLTIYQSDHVISFHKTWIMMKNEKYFAYIKMDFYLKNLKDLRNGIINELIIKDIMQYPYSYYAMTVIFTQILNGLSFLHERCITHRNLKPEKIRIVDNCGCGINIRIADFDLSKIIENSTHSRSKMPLVNDYMAPELVKLSTVIRKRKYDSKVDIFSLGKIMENFASLNMKRRKIGGKKIISCLLFKKCEFEIVKSGLYKLIDKMIATNPEERPTCDQILSVLDNCTLSRENVLKSKMTSIFISNVLIEKTSNDSILYRVLLDEH